MEEYLDTKCSELFENTYLDRTAIYVFLFRNSAASSLTKVIEKSSMFEYESIDGRFKFFAQIENMANFN